MEGQIPEAGWYRDPTDPNRYRYWDGAGWTTNTRVPEPTVPALPVQSVTTPALPVQTVTAIDPSIDALFADTELDDEAPKRRAKRGGIRQRLVVALAVIALAAVGLTAALTFTGGDGPEESSGESGESFDTAAALDTCITRLKDELPGNESEVEWQPADTIEHQQVGDQVHVEFSGLDPDEDPGHRRVIFLCALDGSDLSSVERLYMRFDDLPLEGSGSAEFESVGDSISG